jgi:hypothetical protein
MCASSRQVALASLSWRKAKISGLMEDTTTRVKLLEEVSSEMYLQDVLKSGHR